MAFRTSPAIFPALLLALFALATVGTAKSTAVPIQKNLQYHPVTCYRRSQFCCHSPYVCGQVCHPYNCIRKKVCKIKVIKCIKYKWVRRCSYRCYTKYCTRIRCSPLRIQRGRGYKAPKTTFLSKKFTVKKQ